MSLLMGHRAEGYPQGIRQGPPLALPRQEAGHIGALHRPGPGGGPHHSQVLQHAPLPQGGKPPRQMLDVLKEGVGLPQTQFTGPHIQQPPGVEASDAVKDRRRGGIIAGVQPQGPQAHSVSPS